MLEFLLLWMLVGAQLQCSNGSNTDADQGDENAHEDANRENRSQLKAIRALSAALVRCQCNCEGDREERRERERFSKLPYKEEVECHTQKYFNMCMYEY